MKKMLERESIVTVLAALLAFWEVFADGSVLDPSSKVYVVLSAIMAFIALIIGRSYVKGQAEKTKGVEALLGKARSVEQEAATRLLSALKQSQTKQK